MYITLIPINPKPVIRLPITAMIITKYSLKNEQRLIKGYFSNIQIPNKPPNKRPAHVNAILSI